MRSSVTTGVVDRRVPPQNRLWLSHHWPGDEDRCIAVGSRWVCRRCAVLYPLCLLSAALVSAGVRWPERLDPLLMVALAAPVVLEWWGEHLGMLLHSPRRQVVLTVLAAPAVGVGIARYLTDRGDPVFWWVAGSYAVVCLVPWLVVMSRRQPAQATQPSSKGSASSS